MADLGSIGFFVQSFVYGIGQRSERQLIGNFFVQSFVYVGQRSERQLIGNSLWPLPKEPAPVPDSIYYMMRARRYLRAPPDFETWIAINEPNGNNPSGEPTDQLGIQSSWFA